MAEKRFIPACEVNFLNGVSGRIVRTLLDTGDVGQLTVLDISYQLGPDVTTSEKLSLALTEAAFAEVLVALLGPRLNADDSLRLLEAVGHLTEDEPDPAQPD